MGGCGVGVAGCVLDWTGLALRLLAAFHPPPNLLPERGEGLNWGRGWLLGWELA